MTQKSDAAARAAVLAALLLVLAALDGCGQQEAELLTVLVERGDIEATVSATGTLNPVHMVEVGPRTLP